MADVPVPSEAERSPPASQVTLAEQTGSRDVQAPTTTAAPPADSVDLGQTRKSPASWFQLSGTPTGTSPTVKHSLLAMVPSQPLSRPSSATPPSPAPKLQPPSITAFTQPALPVPAASEPASAAASVPQQDSKEQQQHTASPTRAVAKQEQQASPQQGDPVAIGQSQHETEQQISNKKLRRDKRIQKTAATMHWQLMRRLADISTDVEMLNHEVSIRLQNILQSFCSIHCSTGLDMSIVHACHCSQQPSCCTSNATCAVGATTYRHVIAGCSHQV